MKEEDKYVLRTYIKNLLTMNPIKTGLTKKEVLEFITVDAPPLKMYAMLLDENTMVLHKLPKRANKSRK